MGMHSGFVISRADGRPMYLQIKEQIKHRIVVGDWRPGDEIPSIRQLAVEIRVSVITIKRAYLELERDGVIETQHGKGSFVAAGHGLRPKLARQDLAQHLEQAARLGTSLGLSPEQLAARLLEAAGQLKEEDP